jgi:hypothetical protein
MPHLEHLVRWKAKLDHHKPFQDLGNEIELCLCATLAAKVLDATGMHQRVARKVPFLTKHQKEAHLEWGCEHEGEQ